jgi:hypothetical protein
VAPAPRERAVPEPAFHRFVTRLTVLLAVYSLATVHEGAPRVRSVVHRACELLI